MMQSAFYQVDQSLAPEWEWRFPTKTEYYQLPIAVREDHVDRGGLRLYPLRPPAEREKPKRIEPPKINTRGTARSRRAAQRNWARELTVSDK